MKGPKVVLIYPIFPGEGPLARPVHVRLGERPLGRFGIFIIDLILEGEADKGEEGNSEEQEEGTENGGERLHDDDDAGGNGKKRGQDRRVEQQVSPATSWTAVAITRRSSLKCLSILACGKCRCGESSSGET